ncbi:Hypothetical protein SMAX5B_010618 [Scophthalmus maximus]|uniref:Uncharacterized protein n=1 Tax=Scophthalmus maximus TaxID=52904 RepID=A0A2U9B2M0_SCOMX|nr:Hypothetical protein SMAX5B_010618 [Scophthalmus maximus]
MSEEDRGRRSNSWQPTHLEVTVRGGLTVVVQELWSKNSRLWRAEGCRLNRMSRSCVPIWASGREGAGAGASSKASMGYLNYMNQHATVMGPDRWTFPLVVPRELQIVGTIELLM